MTRQDELNEAWCKYMGKFSTEIMHALAFALRWCDQHPNWISVEDELPEQNRWVLTYNGTSINLLMLAGNGNWYDHSVTQHRNVTHWMLVEPHEKLSSLERNGKNERRLRMDDEVYIAIPVSEYEYLKRCKERLIDLCKSEIEALMQQINEQEINTIINSSINHPKQ